MPFINLLRFLVRCRRDCYFCIFEVFRKIGFSSDPRLNSRLTTLNDTTILLTAAGEQIRWGGPGLKQLVPIMGKPLLERTLNQLKSEGVVITHHKELFYFIHRVPSRHRWIVETILATQKSWGKRTIILLADVKFGDEDINIILNFEGEFGVFGSKSQGEIFALSFTDRVQGKVLYHLRRVLAHAYDGGRGKLWEFYRSYVGLPLDEHSYRGQFIELSNSTDFDTYEEYINFTFNHRYKKRF